MNSELQVTSFVFDAASYDNIKQTLFNNGINNYDDFYKQFIY